jgi:hypothetical protein
MAVNLAKTVTHKFHRVSALAMLKSLGDPTVQYFAEEVNNGGDPNDIRIYMVVSKKYPEMLRYVQLQTNHITRIRREFENEIARLREHYDKGLISVVEYASGIEFAASCLKRDMEGLLEF